MIDLRSDTVTKPVPEMREVIAQGDVGDDVYGEDPTVNELQRKAAEKFGKEAGLFVPSGSMGNQVAVNIHTKPSNEVILDSDCHIYNFEMGTMSSFSGVMPRPIITEKNYLPIEKVEKEIRPEKYYLSRTGLITLENTHNRKGGVIYPEPEKNKIIRLAENKNIPIHLDGARIFNASIATGTSVKKLTEGFDSVMFCLSKGLGAPIGSLLLGDREFIKKARRTRKMLGGGMRQAGILAAAGIYALNNHVKRLEEDHENSELLARSIRELDDIEVNDPETNIVIIRLTSDALTSQEFIEKLEEKNILAGAIGPQKIRLVTHLGVDRTDVEKAIDSIKSIVC